MYGTYRWVLTVLRCEGWIESAALFSERAWRGSARQLSGHASCGHITFSSPDYITRETQCTQTPVSGGGSRLISARHSAPGPVLNWPPYEQYLQTHIGHALCNSFYHHTTHLDTTADRISPGASLPASYDGSSTAHVGLSAHVFFHLRLLVLVHLAVTVELG